jgi:Uma2 family endonuclease
MADTRPRILQRLEFEKAAEAYLRGLPPEHFMEATPQATQREITVESLALVKGRRPEVQYFNELLVEYRLPRSREIRKVVPDNMVVVHHEPIQAAGSYNLPMQPARPFWVLEYVSRASERKDYDDNFQKYESELKVPYYLLFQPEAQEVTLYRRRRARYVSVRPNAEGRLALPELELEMAIQGGWVRFWFRGQLLALPADLQRQIDQLREQMAEVARQRDEANRRAEEEARRRAEAERWAAEEARQRQEAERQRDEVERELARLRALLGEQGGR